jgi:hypothetical protein
MSIPDLLNQKYAWILVFMQTSILMSSCTGTEGPPFRISVEAEEIVYKYEPPGNGAGPMWCHGNTCIVRFGNKLVASGMETIEHALPLNNTRWLLFERTEEGWDLLMKDTTERTREPSPVGILNSTGTVLLSVNPALTGPGIRNGPAQPRMLQFDGRDLRSGYQTIIPEWDGNPNFTEHSYRTFVVDGRADEFILIQNTGYDLAEWMFFDHNGKQHSQGQLVWPWGEGYEDPQPVRICYPAAQLADREVHFLGVSDIVEPRKAWKDYKFKLTGREWDYDFRRLFYTWSRDISAGLFEPWLEVASREQTAGHIFPCDLWRAPDGTVHILWTERALDERLREDFFPGQEQSQALNHAVIREGEVIFRQPVMLGHEQDTLLPGRGRFHVTPDDRLYVFYHVYAKNADFSQNRVVEILDDYRLGKDVAVPLKRPFRSFYTATVRAGCEPSDVIDVFGEDDRREMRYARIRIIPD